MAQVSLKSCENDIRNFIDNRQFDEAMSTGQHILQYYPKHVRTYSLLGEVCLATGRFDEAADTLLRVLSVDPENVAARLGLSATHEATADLPGAIEQMRIAFDLAPSTRAMHDQMHRLLKLQKGEPVPKLKLTRQGLGRIYMRGELYTQAADEFEALLRENPDQVDVEVSLAEALWQDGQRIRSIEVCQSVLNKLPYCLKAHLILAETWLRSDREDEAEAHLRTVRDVDPDGEVSFTLLGDASPMLRTDVLIPAIGDGAAVEQPGTAAPGSAPAGAGGEPEISDIDVSDIPDWLRQAKPDEAADENISEAELPAWLTAGTPEPVQTTSVSIPSWLLTAAPGTVEQHPDVEEIPELDDYDVTPRSAGDALPPWLQGASEKPASTDDAADDETIVAGDILPPWLDALDATVPAEAAAEPAAMSEQAPTPEPAAPDAPAEVEVEESTQVPAWMQSLLLEERLEDEAAGEAAGVTEAATFPAWMSDLESAAGVRPTAVERPDVAAESEDAEPAPAVAEPSVQEEQEPEWLRILRGGAETEPVPAEQPAELNVTAPAEQDELPPWLAGVEQPGSAAPALVEMPENEADDTAVGLAIAEEALGEPQPEQEPSWLRILRQNGAADAAEEGVEGITEEEAEAGIPAWLRDLQTQEGTDSPALPSETALTESGLIDEMTAAQLAEEAMTALVASPVVEADAESQDGAAPMPPLSEGRKADLPTQQQLTEVGLIVEAEPEPASATAEGADLPDWLRKAAFAEGLIGKPPADAAQEAPATLAEAADVPAGEEVPVALEEADEGPDWLKMFQQKRPPNYVTPEDLDADTGDLEEPALPDAQQDTLDIPEWLQLLRQGEEGQLAEVGEADEPSAGPEPGGAAETAAGEEPAADNEAPAETAPVPVEAPAATAEEAISAGEAAVKADPKNYAARWVLVQEYARSGNHEAAVAHCQILVESGELVPEVLQYLEGLCGSGVQTRGVYQVLGDGYFKQDRFQEATKAYRSALSMLG